MAAKQSWEYPGLFFVFMGFCMLLIVSSLKACTPVRHVYYRVSYRTNFVYYRGGLSLKNGCFLPLFWNYRGVITHFCHAICHTNCHTNPILGPFLTVSDVQFLGIQEYHLIRD